MKEEDIRNEILEILNVYSSHQVNLASMAAKQEISQHLAKELHKKFELEIEALKDERDSLWSLLEEIKEADIKNYAGEFQHMLDRKLTEVKMMAAMKPAEA
jgi:RNase H-fold protein (predicted Holliday junction resolvase)